MAAPTIGTPGTLAAAGFGSFIDVTLPTHAIDDILVIPVVASQDNNTVGGSFAAPTGWTKAVELLETSGSNTISEWCLFWKRATSAAESTPRVELPSGWDTGNDTCRSGRCYVISGCETTGDPFDAAVASAIHKTDDQAFPAVTVSGADRLVVQFSMSEGDNGPEITAATGWTIGTSATTATGNDATHGYAYKTASTSTSADTATISIGTATGYAFIGVSFKPPGASGTSGSGAPSLARHTAAGSGTATAPATTGTSATTLTRHTAAGAGSTGTEGSSATTLVRHTGAGAGSTGTSGTSATTITRHTAAGAGSTGTSGSGAPSLARHTAAGSGTHTPPGGIGSGSPTLARHTAAGAGSTGTSGSSATTLTRHTAAGAGSTGTEGSSATTLARHTAAGTGTTTAPGVTSGSGSPTLTRHTAAGTGSTGTTGTGSPTCTRHTAAGVGTTTSPSASGSGAVTLVRHVAAGSGVITGPSVTGSGTLLLARHSASGVGVGPGTATMTKQRSVVGGMERDVRPSERRSILDLRRITQNKPDITVGVSEPAQAALGDFWFNLTVMKYWNGTEWVEI